MKQQPQNYKFQSQGISFVISSSNMKNALVCSSSSKHQTTLQTSDLKS